VSVQESIYRHSPPLVQHALTSIKGLEYRRFRYTADTWRHYDFLQTSQWWSHQQFEDYQFKQLKRLIELARTRSPYYCELYGLHRIHEDVLKDVADIQLLPVVSKECLRRRTDDFVPSDLNRQRMWVARTSGTTGTPLTVYHTHESMQKRFAFMERLYHWYTPNDWRRRASFTGRLIVDPQDMNGPFHRSNVPIRQQLYSSHHLSSANLTKYVDELNDFRPDQIDGIASSIYVIANYLEKTQRIGADDLRPNVVIPTSETLWPQFRRRIEKAFLCPVSNQYSSQEGAPLVAECPEGGFHTCPESGIFEVLRADNTWCEPGEVGRLVVTSFLSEGTPLIRYDIGDLAAWRAGKCSCGREMPMLETIVGRVDDMFFTPERGIIPRVDSAFKSLPSSIMAAQVAQVSAIRFELRIVADKSRYLPEHGESVRANLYDYLGLSVEIDLVLLDNMPRSSGGKFKAMINECKDPYVQNAIMDEWNSTNVSAEHG
jgi:phenylacetate-CoA ligase